MSTKNKIVISVIGIAAIVVPAILLIVFSSRVPQEPAASGANRTIDSANIDSAVKEQPASQISVPTPIPASPSAPLKPVTAPGLEATQAGSL